MQLSRFRIYKALIAGGLGVAVAVAVCTDNAMIALAAVVAAIALAFILERGNKEIVRDERILQINGKAASVSFNILLLLAAAVALGTALFRNSLPQNIVFAGSMMGYLICIALMLYLGLYVYYSRKL